MTKDKWQTVKFGDVVHRVRETEHNPLENGITRYVGLGDLDPESIQLKRWGDLREDSTSFTRRFREGQMLFARRRAYQRKAALAPFDGICSGDIIVMEAKPDKLLPDLLPFLIHTDGFFDYAMRTSAGSLSPRTKWSHLAKYEFTLPPLDEQRRIAEILWAVEFANREWENVIESLIQLRDVMSFELFNHDLDNVPEIKCSELCDEITVGIVVKPASFYVKNGGVPALRSLNVFPNRYVLDDLVYLSDSGHEQHEKSQLNEGDVLVVRTGRPGEAVVVDESVAGFNCIDLIIVRTGEKISPHYLIHYINSAAGKKELYRLTAGTAQKHLNVTALNGVRIPLRNKKDQHHIVDTFSAMDERLEITRRHLVSSQQLKKTLMANLFEAS